MSNGSWSAIFLRNKYCPRIFELSVVAEIDFVLRRQEAVGKTREEQPVYSTCRTQGGGCSPRVLSRRQPAWHHPAPVFQPHRPEPRPRAVTERSFWKGRAGTGTHP